MKRICGMPGGKVSKTCGCECETPMPENGSLEDLVSWWIAAKRPFFKKMLCFFGEGSLDLAIKRAAAKGSTEGESCYYSHQNRISKEKLSQWQALLRRNKAEISECEKESFEDLLGLLEGFKPNGIGPLTCYDTAFRISAKLGCLPKKVVHLHAKAQIPGAKQYPKKDVPRLVADFPPTVKQRLKAYEIEDFLCVCQDKLKPSMFKEMLKQ